MKILVFGGTTEGRLVAGELCGMGHEITVSVATELGAEQLTELSGVEVHVGRLDVCDIVELLRSKSFDICIDGTHPYAAVVSANVRKATEEADVPYMRLLREAGSNFSYEDIASKQKALFFDSASEVAKWCRENLGENERVLLTTGSKEARAYSECDLSRIYIRILPSDESYELCARAGFEESNIIQAWGPFSEEANLEVIRNLGITHLVSKDSGATGGFPEKLAAAEKSGITILIIRRPVETGYSMSEVLESVSKM